MAICPYCFNKIDLKKLDLRCSSQSCLEPGFTYRHIIPRKLAKVDRKGYGTCDKCNKSTHILVCGSCGHDLPDTITNSETKVISVVGAAACGKSYFIAALLRQIMEEGLLAKTNGASTTFLPGSREIYTTRYKQKMDSCLPMDATNFVTDIVKDNPPILVQLTSMSAKNKKIDNTYSFFDAAGESFDKPDVLASVTPYIAHSDAIVIILDPRQIPRVDEAVTSAMPCLPAIAERHYEELINNIANVIYDNNKIKRTKKIDIPVCLAFSKWDMLINTPGLLPEDMNVSRSDVSSAKNGFNADMVMNSSAEIRSLLNEWDPNVLITLESRFETVTYFGFSAWGMGSKDGTTIPAIASFRVEDPFLWILNKNKLI